jgi:hypothetical protein
MQSMSNYLEREVKRRHFVMARWDFREQEKMELEMEAKRKAGVSIPLNLLNLIVFKFSVN